MSDNRIPDYKGDGVAVWVNKDKNGKPLLCIKVLKMPVIYAFRNEPKPEPKPDPVPQQHNEIDVELV